MALTPGSICLGARGVTARRLRDGLSITGDAVGFGSNRLLVLVSCIVLFDSPHAGCVIGDFSDGEFFAFQTVRSHGAGHGSSLVSREGK